MRRLPLLAALATLSLAGTAWAYLLPPGSLVRKSQAKREELGLHSMQVSGSLTLTGQAAQALAGKVGRSVDGDELSVPVVATYKMPGRCRLEVAAPGAAPGPRLFASDRNGSISGSPELQVVQVLYALSCPLLASRGGDEEARAISEWAKGLGVDFSTTSLSRAPNAIAEVIGAGPREPTKPQLWIDKDQFVPLRVIAKRGGTTYDLRLDPGAGIGDSHPRTIELWQAAGAGQPEQLLARLSAEKIEPNAKVADNF